MRKATTYDWKDSNLAMFGSDTERAVKKESAETEKAWHGAGTEVGLNIWRIEQFKVVAWPQADYGRFFQGDSYIVLNTYKLPGQDDLKYDIHFWIGKESSQDEYGTAAYKTVELDTYLDDKPIQHREVQNYESSLFKSYFSRIEYLYGGTPSGFRTVKTEEFNVRLFHFRAENKQVIVKEIGKSRENINDDDVYILDSGSRIIQYIGTTANKDEKFRAMQYVNELKGKRCGKTELEIIDNGSTTKDESNVFLGQLDDSPKDEDDVPYAPFEKSLYKLSDASGTMQFTFVASGCLRLSMIDDEDVFILDNGDSLFTYAGPGCSDNERKSVMSYAHRYLMNSDHPLINVTCIKNRNDEQFTACFDN